MKTMFFFAQAYGNLVTFLLIEVLVILALIAGIAKCYSISRRPTTNTKCVMALGLLLLACLIPHLSQTASAIVPLPFPELAEFISLAITLGSAVLAVIGLREYSRSRGAYKQGKAQAIWTLALSAFVAAYPIRSSPRRDGTSCVSRNLASQLRYWCSPTSISGSSCLANHGRKRKVTRSI